MAACISRWHESILAVAMIAGYDSGRRLRGVTRNYSHNFAKFTHVLWNARRLPRAHWSRQTISSYDSRVSNKTSPIFGTQCSPSDLTQSGATTELLYRSTTPSCLVSCLAFCGTFSGASGHANDAQKQGIFQAAWTKKSRTRSGEPSVST